MKKLLFILAIALLSANAFSQDFLLKYKTIDIDSILTINGEQFRFYLAQNLSYPIDAQQKEIGGTYIGCISLDEKGNLIKVFTINSLSKSIDNSFESIIEKAWKKNKAVVKNIKDSIDIICPLEFKLSEGSMAIPFQYEMNDAPDFISESLVLVGYPSPARKLNIQADQNVINTAQSQYEAGNYKKSLKAADEIIRRNPYNADMLLLRAKIYVGMGEKDLARRDYYYLKNFLKNDNYLKIEPLL